MTDDSSIPENDNINGDDMLIINGKRLNSPREIGQAAHKLLDSFGRAHRKSHEELWKMILNFGRMLRAGRDLYQGDDIGFGAWIKEYRLDSGKLGGNQRERHACMQLAELYDVGGKPDDEGAIPRKLDLTGCNYSTPTDIMKWVRKTQRELLGLPPAKKKLKKKGGKKGAPKDVGEVDDEEIGDLGDEDGEEDSLVVQLRSEILRLRDENTKLKADNANLRAQLGLDEEDGDGDRPVL